MIAASTSTATTTKTIGTSTPAIMKTPSTARTLILPPCHETLFIAKDGTESRESLSGFPLRREDARREMGTSYSVERPIRIACGR